MRLFLILSCLIIVSILIVGIVVRIKFEPKIVIVPHQNADIITRSNVFKKVAEERLVTNKIILIGPDHFLPSGYGIKYTTWNWNIPEGQIKFGKTILSDEFLARISNSEDIKQDHAITNLLKDIKIYYPNAEIIPLLIGMRTELSDLDALYEEIRSSCGYDCLLITSVDFSHYLPYPSANIHDEYSRSLLESKSFKQAESMEVDSPQSLYIAMRLANYYKMHFTFLNHSNSAEITRNPRVESTGHVLGYYSYKLNSPMFTKNESFTLAYNTSPNKLNLDPRYFYGTSLVDLKLDSPYEARNLKIIPNDSPLTNFVCEKNSLQINLGSDILIIGDIREDRTIINIYPKEKIQDLIEELTCVSYDNFLNELVIN